MLANSHKTTQDVLETLFEGICVSPYSWTLLVVSASGSSSEVETFSSSSESDDSVSSLDGGLRQRVSKPWSNTSDKGGRQVESGVHLTNSELLGLAPTALSSSAALSRLSLVVICIFPPLRLVRYWRASKGKGQGHLVEGRRMLGPLH